MRILASCGVAISLFALMPLVGYTAVFGDSPDQRIVVKLEVITAEGEPYRGEIHLIAVEAKDAVHLSTNRYGLCFTHLLSRMQYAVSAGGFERFATFTTPSAEEGEMSIELTLPKPDLLGKMASEGRGLIIFTYLDSSGKPYAGQTLFAVDKANREYKTLTNSDGVARLEVPLNAEYSFSVRDWMNFAQHHFNETPRFQTAEISLDLSAQRLAKPQRSAKREQPSLPVRRNYRGRSDSLDAARAKINRSMKGATRSSFAIPSRNVKPSPHVTKRVIEGVYMLREAVIEAEKRDPRFSSRTQLELLRPLLRNKWDDLVVVVDVTCSMDPFLEEYLLWLVIQNNVSRIVGCVFFNDGDGTPVEVKNIGSTGGIRHSSNNLRELADTMVKSISFGCSGDEAENDLEALLYAQQQFQSASSIMLIADNRSAVRDLELLSQLQTPVHVMLCGQREGGKNLPPHEDYLTIAYRTGGSLHTLEEDISAQKLHSAGGAVRLFDWQYRYLKGRFVRE